MATMSPSWIIPSHFFITKTRGIDRSWAVDKCRYQFSPSTPNRNEVMVFYFFEKYYFFFVNGWQYPGNHVSTWLKPASCSKLDRFWNISGNSQLALRPREESAPSAQQKWKLYPTGRSRTPRLMVASHVSIRAGSIDRASHYLTSHPYLEVVPPRSCFSFRAF